MHIQRFAASLLLVAAVVAPRGAIAQTRPRHPYALSGCWRVDTTRTLVLDGTNGHIETVDLIGFAASPVHSTLTWLPSEHLYVVDAPGATGFANLTVSIDPHGVPSLVRWVPDPGRYMTRAWQAQHHAIHPLRIAARWALTRCARP